MIEITTNTIAWGWPQLMRLQLIISYRIRYKAYFRFHSVSLWYHDVVYSQGEKRTQPTLTNFFAKKSKCLSEENLENSDCESDGPSSEKASGNCAQDLSSKDEPRRLPQESYKFPQKMYRGELRQFSHKWLKQYEWLEYSESQDAVYCKCCRHFSSHVSPFTSSGLSNWQVLCRKLKNHSVTGQHKTASEKH